MTGGAGRAHPGRITAQCCIAGGGPAGLMLGFLLGRAGIDVVVLEKHRDFLRDFRGDTVHPSTLQIADEVGLLKDFLARPHQKVHALRGRVGDAIVTVADFRHLRVCCPYIALMPQWEFLDLIATHARRLPTFHLRMESEVEALTANAAGHITGVRARTPHGPLEVAAALVVGADGRESAVRREAKLEVQDFGAPMDVLWLRLSRTPADPDDTFGRFEAGRILVMIDRAEYWQCAFVIPKGGYGAVHGAGLPELRAQIRALAPWLGERVDEIRSWDDVRLLTVTVDRLRRWYRAGLVCIGDAAHAMSPIGGVGVNLAIQDAVAAANLLSGPLLAGAVGTDDLLRLQRRREWPTRVTQSLQRMIQRRVIGSALDQRGPLEMPWLLRLLERFPPLRRIPGRLIGIGVRPEHVAAATRTPTRRPAGAGAR